MTGRHRSGGGGATKRRAGWSVLGALLVLAVIATLTVRWILDAGSDCKQQVTLTVDAAPSIAPAVTEFIEKRLPQIEGEAQCLRPQVRTASPKSVTDAFTEDEPGQRPADVWIPDSTVWLQRANDAGANIPERGTSIATSPVVLATTERTATEAGWPAKPAVWSEILDDPSSPGISDPSVDTSALFALMGIDNLSWPTAKRTKSITTLSKLTMTANDDPYHRLPRGGSTPTVTVFPSSEQQVLRHNRTAPWGSSGSAVAAYPDNPTPWLDYPVVVRTDLDEGQRAAGEALRKVLRGPAAALVFAQHGFRDADGELAGPAARDGRVHAGAGPVGPPPSAEHGEAVLKQWAALSRVARVLVVLDVSGSMNAPVGDSGKTRMLVTVEAASKGLRLFRPGTQLAMWEFSTNLDGNADHREIVPFKPIIQHIADDLPDKLGDLLSTPTGQTGLYDTVLAGYRETMRVWDPAHLNLLVVLTDGRNEDEDGTSRSQLLTQLARLTDLDRPAPIVFVGLGTDVDPKELRDVSRVTGGQTFLAPKVTDIQRIFFTALGNLACPGGDC
ncbi:MAG: substrate-binding and VWA domain-containing protein [Haloechinothrix sp.]